jgi:hypothetical protein
MLARREALVGRYESTIERHRSTIVPRRCADASKVLYFGIPKLDGTRSQSVADLGYRVGNITN